MNYGLNYPTGKDWITSSNQFEKELKIVTGGSHTDKEDRKLYSSSMEKIHTELVKIFDKDLRILLLVTLEDGSVWEGYNVWNGKGKIEDVKNQKGMGKKLLDGSTP